jgi:glycosyltransferase involved in cell wall biosynthesis
MTRKKTVVILGIDTVLKKNLLQLQCGKDLSFDFIILTNDSLKSSAQFENESCKIKIMKSDFWSRLRQVINTLVDNREQINHVEIYPGGRFSPIYALISRFLNIPSIVVERGDIQRFLELKGPLRFFLSLTYRLATLVWYKEPYMKDILSQQLKVKRLFFLPNAIQLDSPPTLPAFAQRDYNFMWANRLVKQRRAEWFVENLRNEALGETNNVLLGIMPQAADQDVIKTQKYVEEICPPSLTLLPYVNPQPYYQRAKFFVLAAEIVYGNNALFEAMSYGVIPIITQQPHTDEIIPSKNFGLHCLFEKESLLDAMKRAAAMTREEYDQISTNVQSHVFEKFGKGAWRQGLKKLYEEIRS